MLVQALFIIGHDLDDAAIGDAFMGTFLDHVRDFVAERDGVA